MNWNGVPCKPPCNRPRATKSTPPEPWGSAAGRFTGSSRNTVWKRRKVILASRHRREPANVVKFEYGSQTPGQAGTRISSRCATAAPFRFVWRLLAMRRWFASFFTSFLQSRAGADFWPPVSRQTRSSSGCAITRIRRPACLSSRCETATGCRRWLQRDRITRHGIDAAEVAFAVADELQGRGLGTLLLERLAMLAVRHSFKRFWAVTQADNHLMREVFRESGFTVNETSGQGEIEVNFSIRASENSQVRCDLRHRLATVASLTPFFRPRAIALIGASRRKDSIGARLLEAIVSGGFPRPNRSN